MSLIYMDIEDGEYPGLTITIDHSANSPTDADIMGLAEAILATDLVQHIPWINTPAIANVQTPSVHNIYPPE